MPGLRNRGDLKRQMEKGWQDTPPATVDWSHLWKLIRDSEADGRVEFDRFFAEGIRERALRRLKEKSAANAVVDQSFQSLVLLIRKHDLEPPELPSWIGAAEMLAVETLSARRSAVTKDENYQDAFLALVTRRSQTAERFPTPISRKNANRVVPVIAQAVAVFGDEHKASHWLTSPLEILDGSTPAQLLARKGGVERVEQLLTRIEHNVPS